MAGMERESYRRAVCEISQMIAPGWERQRARIEEAVAPMRGWMITQVDRVPTIRCSELAAGAGDTGFEALPSSASAAA